MGSAFYIVENAIYACQQARPAEVKKVKMAETSASNSNNKIKRGRQVCRKLERAVFIIFVAMEI